MIAHGVLRRGCWSCVVSAGLLRFFLVGHYELASNTLINECRVGDVASAAMDGVVPESRQDGLLREERH